MLGISIRAGSLYGVSAVNDRVDLMQFFTSHILTELQDTNHSVRPMVKASAIKFAWTFRNQFSKENIASLMPLLIAHLSSPSVVVHTYSAAAIEKFLTCKEITNSGAVGPMATMVSKKVKFGGNDLKPFLESLFPALFAIVDNQEWNENEYVMKCIMRSLSSAREDIAQVTEVVLEKLNAALFVVAKNPRNPQYNHFMFESIAILVKSVCSKHPEHVATFEGLLFPPFQTVLQMDVSEFTPYVFQILAQLLEYRAANTGLGDAYTMLFQPLLTPVLWESKGNVPALTRLLQAYLQKGAADIVAKNQLSPLLGVFQKLLSSRGTEISAFDLLGSVTKYIPANVLEPMIKQIFNFLLIRLQAGKTARYVRLVSGYFAQYVGQFGSQKWFEIMNSFQPGLANMVLSQVWLTRLSTDEPFGMEIKIQAVGLTKIVCETPSLLSDATGQQTLLRALTSLVKILSTQAAFFGKAVEELDQTVEIGYDPTFSKLHFATRAPIDPFSEIKDPVGAFATTMSQAISSNASLSTFMQQGSQSDPKTFASLQGIMHKAGLHI
jgi:exportin-2 (importin alpha re-exporter)